MAELVVVTRGLEKRFGHTLAIAGVDLVVPQGSVFGFLGPNGAGKTTTLRMLIGLIKASAGSVSVFGRDGWRERRAIQQMVGYLPGDVRLYNDATGLENLDFLAHLHTLPPVRRTQMVERFEMPQAVLARKARTYSRGTLQKLGLIACLQHDAPLLVLDEPTEGLDPLMQAVFAEFLEEERDSGKTVLLSSHALSEVERSCDVVAIIREGRLLFQGPIVELRSQARRSLEVVFEKPVEIDWSAFAMVEEVKGTRQHHFVQFRGNPGPLLKALVDQPVADLTLGNESLEDTFLTFYREPDK